VSLVNPSLHATNAFILGCGKRCGLRNEVSHGETLHSPMGASAVMGESLSRTATTDRLGGSSETVPPFGIGWRGLEEVVLGGMVRLVLGQCIFVLRDGENLRGGFIWKIR
jgi:hypothetical protein